MKKHTNDLFGAKNRGVVLIVSLNVDSLSERDVSIMVTLPAEAGTNYTLVRDLLVDGMDIIRINCAHDGPDVWRQMIGTFAALSCLVLYKL
jgi:hypothetical protein